MQTTKIIIFAFSFLCTFSQICLNNQGNPVDWWIVLKPPFEAASKGFLYYDAQMNNGQFKYIDQRIDQGYTSLTLTLTAINRYSLEHVAWNDEKPEGQTSSAKAHSKGLIAYDIKNTNGFYLVHSIPKYPNFYSNLVDVTIGDSQNIYGQHLGCFTLALRYLDKIALNFLITQPFVYQSVIKENNSLTQNILALSKSLFPHSDNLFVTSEFVSSSYTLKSIYKNNKINGSIFEDGLINYLNIKTIFAETWGRPIEPSWCHEQFKVLNVESISLPPLFWVESQDHSKWVTTAQNYVCFGDMNRMNSQWKRGGAFFCLQNQSLASALLRAIAYSDVC